MALDPKKWTVKTQEAFAAAIDLAKARSNPELTPDHLLAAITDGEFPPRAELPPEQQLAERFGVSRLTVREGIRGLAGHGVLVRDCSSFGKRSFTLWSIC